MEQYLPLFFLLVLAVLFAAVSLIASRLLAPRRPTVPKLAPYECGIVPAREAPERIPVRFFLVAMAFIVFDVEIVLFYPYAVARGQLGVFGLVVVLVFTFAVFESFIYLIGEGALDWGPEAASSPVALTTGASAATATADRAELPTGAAAPGASATTADASMVSPQRTARTTVRRVGLEGRRDPGLVPTASTGGTDETGSEDADADEAGGTASTGNEADADETDGTASTGNEADADETDGARPDGEGEKA